MSISDVTSNSGVSQPSWRSTVHQAREDFAQLFQGLQAGNLSNAQQAYAALQQLRSGNPSPATTSSSTSADAGSGATAPISANGTATSASSISSDWSSLGQALQSGSLTSAQDAFAKLGQDLQASIQGSGHHHHHAMNKAQAVYSAMQASSSTSASATAPNGGTDSTDSVNADLNALKLALQSGSTSSAQDLLAKLEQNLQASGHSSVHHHHHHGGFSTQNPAAAYSGASVTNVNASALVATSGASSSASAST
ncbi:MAG TPA: hypothetical protein VMV75_05640 [Sulfuricella sp.]|nr:hypothetical protein [Sulfuricella sp.]